MTLYEYDSRWPDDFAPRGGGSVVRLGDVVLGLERVGSTSVPGLVAKPRIDIQLVVADPADEASYGRASAGRRLHAAHP